MMAASTSHDHRMPRHRYNVRSNAAGAGGFVHHTANFADAKVFSRKMFMINAMTREEICKELDQVRQTHHHLSSYKTLQRQLKNYYRRQRAFALGGNRTGRVNNKFATSAFYDYMVVIDFECTCEDNVYEYEHEIIEFPAVLVDVHKQKIVDEFRSFVKPQLRPVLSEFAIQLTGVTQADVDRAPGFLEVLQLFREWCLSWGLGVDKKYAIVTDGPWDIAKFFQMQCLFSGLDRVPHDYRSYINLRRAFSACYPESKNKDAKPLGTTTNGADTDTTAPVNGTAGGTANNQDKKEVVPNVLNRPSNYTTTDWRNLAGMLEYLSMQFEGREHCGLDDAKNIARIAIHLIKEGAEIRINERLLRRELADKILSERQKFRQEREALSRDAAVGARSNRADLIAEGMGQLMINEQKPELTQKREPRPDPTPEDKERQFWREHLPYKTVTVTRNEFLMELYDDCDSCGEEQ